MEIWETKPPGTLWATPGLLQEPFIFTCTIKIISHSRFLLDHVIFTP